MAIIISFLFFTGLVAFLTWKITHNENRDSSDGYFLAGRSLTAGYIAGSLLLTNLSTEQLVGLNGAAFADGLAVMAWEVIAGFSLVVMALFFLPKYLKSGIATVPQFLELRFAHSTRVITTLIFIVAYAAILLPIILYTGAKGLFGILNVAELLNLNEPQAITLLVWVIGIIGSIYAIVGGLRSVAVSDTLNGFGLLVGGMMITWFALRSIHPNVGLALEQMRSAAPEKFNSLGGQNSSVPFSTLFSGVLLLNLFYWCTNQQIIQRTFGATNLAEGQKGVLLASFFKILAPIILVLPGMVAFYQFGRIEFQDNLVPIADISGEGINLVVQGDDGSQQLLINSDIPSESITAQVGDTLTWQQKSYTVQQRIDQPHVVLVNTNGQLQSVPSEDGSQKIAPRNKDLAYGRLVQSVLPGWLTGFFAAAVIGAILSSFNSALNSAATLFSLGVYKPMMHPQATDQQVIRAGKLFGWIIAIASMIVAPMLVGQDSIFGYLQKMNGLYFIPIFSVVVMGMLHRRVPTSAANVALLLGFFTIIAGYFVPGAKEIAAMIHEFHFLGIVFATLVVLMFIAGTVAPRSEPWVQTYSQDVDLTPWKWAVPAGVTLVVIVLGLYIYFANPAVF